MNRVIQTAEPADRTTAFQLSLVACVYLLVPIGEISAIGAPAIDIFNKRASTVLKEVYVQWSSI